MIDYKRKLSSAILKDSFLSENDEIKAFEIFINEELGWALITPRPFSFPKEDSPAGPDSRPRILHLLPQEQLEDH